MAKKKKIKRALAIGSEYHAQQLYPDYKIIAPDKMDLILPSSDFNRYDAIVAYFVLQRATNANSEEVVQSWARALKKDGEVHINVPALEWLGEEFRKAKRSPAILMHIFGTQIGDDFWQSAYTMDRLRFLFEQVGLLARFARSYPYKFNINNNEFKAMQHHIVGVKL